MTLDSRTKIDYKKIKEQMLIGEQSFADQTEQSYKNSLIEVADYISQNAGHKNIVLIAGPSASGKTTTSHILMEKLDRRGIASVVVSMDDFFLDRDESPLLPNGQKDFESITALDIDLFKECMDNLLEQRRSMMPLFDFLTGEKDDGAYVMKLASNTVVIVEGLHAFNPAIISEKMKERCVKLYVCTNTDFVDSEHTISADALRFTRRLVRDYFKRGASVRRTEDLWLNVRAGEQKFIIPYKKDADFLIDTTHLYEPFLYKVELNKIATKDSNVLPYLRVFDIDIEFDRKFISKDSLVWEFLIR